MVPTEVDRTATFITVIVLWLEVIAQILQVLVIAVLIDARIARFIHIFQPSPSHDLDNRDNVCITTTIESAIKIVSSFVSHVSKKSG
mgnify:FL=1